MIIKYSPLPDIKTKIILAPLLPVTFVNGEYEFSTLALVDSGATGAVISTIIADDLHIKWEKIPATPGFSVGGIFRSHRFNNLYIEALNHKFKLDVNIIEGISPYKCILGQADIFQRAKITFERYKYQFEIEFREFN